MSCLALCRFKVDKPLVVRDSSPMIGSPYKLGDDLCAVVVVVVVVSSNSGASSCGIVILLSNSREKSASYSSLSVGSYHGY